MARNRRARSLRRLGCSLMAAACLLLARQVHRRQAGDTTVTAPESAAPVRQAAPIRQADPDPVASGVLRNAAPVHQAAPDVAPIQQAPEPPPTTPQGFRTAGTTLPFPGNPPPAGAVNPQVEQARAAVRHSASAANLRALAETCEAAGLNQEAADAYRREAAIYRRNGDPNGARVEESKADWLASNVVLYREERLGKLPAGLAKYEPASGCYLGAIIERDNRVRRDPATFNELTGRHHAILFDYREYGKPFPADWAAKLKAAGAAAQISFEPNHGLDRVQDDDYLQSFARDCSAADMPVFLRYAAEMNGDWTNYSGDPAAYIEKWRLVHDVMARLAPNVAMVWTPNAMPTDNIPDFYPGDDYVDWVGVNFYAVRFHNNDPAYPADREDPSDYLKAVYGLYAAKKPIMICETAATHYCSVEHEEIPQFAVDKLQMLYAALPRRYPRVKAVCWYDIDNRKNAGRAERRTNDFSLTDNDQVLEGYRRAIADPYFLEQVVTGSEQVGGVRYGEVAAGQTLTGTVRLNAHAKTFSDRPVVAWMLDGKGQLALGTRPYAFEWDTTKVANGEHTLKALIVVDGRLAGRQTWALKVAN